MNKRKAAAAVAAGLVLLMAAVLSVGSRVKLMQPPFIAEAAESTAVLSGDTLTLRGNVVKSDVQTFAKNADVKKVVCEPGTVFPADCDQLFWEFQAESMDLSNADTSKVTTMRSMFFDCRRLESLNLSSFNTSRVTDMYKMFHTCMKIQVLDLSSFDTSNVTNMLNMFEYCRCLKQIEFGRFHTSKVNGERMVSMFSGCYDLTDLNLSSFDVSNVTSLAGMFSDCRSLKELDLSSFDTSKVTNMSCLFNGCGSLESVDLSSFDTSNVTSISKMFYGCGSLKSVDLSHFDTSNLKQASGIFRECVSLESLIDPAGYSFDRRDVNLFSNCPLFIAAEVKNVSISLDGKIGLHFYVAFNTGEPVIKIEGCDEIQNNTERKPYQQSDGIYKFTYYVNALQASEPVTLKLLSIGQISNSDGELLPNKTMQYSVRQYLEDSEQYDFDEKTQNLIRALEQYLNASENYFFQKGHALNISYPSITRTENRGNYNKNELFDLSLVLNSGTDLRIYPIKEKLEYYGYDESEYNYCDWACIDDDSWEDLQKGVGADNRRYAAIQSIPAHRLLSVYETMLIDTGIKINLCPLDYCALVLQRDSTSKALKDVCAALYYYGVAARDYYNALNS